MEIKTTAKKSTLVIIMIVTLLAAIASFFWSFKMRNDDTKASEDYDRVDGEITDVKAVYNSTDDGSRYTYEACISFITKEDEQYCCWTDDIFQNEPEIGETVDVMVLPDSDGEFYVAKKDWMMKCYLPYERQYDTFIFLGCFMLTFSMVMLGSIVGERKTGFLIIGIGMVILGIGGIFFAATTVGGPAYLIAVFGAFGVLMIVKALKYDPEVEKQRKADREAMIQQANPYYPGESNTQMPNYYNPDNSTQMPNYYDPNSNPQTPNYYQPTDSNNQQ